MLQQYNHQLFQDIAQVKHHLIHDLKLLSIDRDDDDFNVNDESFRTTFHHERTLFSNNQFWNSTLSTRLNREFSQISRLGSGGFGTVVKARHELDSKFYAIKIIKLSLSSPLTSSFTSTFTSPLITSQQDQQETDPVMKEVEFLSTLHHEHIVRYYNVWKEHVPDERLYIQMEYCESTLRQLINMKLNRALAWTYLEQVLKALKPENILIKNDMIKLGDFGLSYNHKHETAKHDRGSSLYMNQEPRENNPKFDIFSLGMIFFEMLTAKSKRSNNDKRKDLKLLKDNPSTFLSSLCENSPYDLYPMEKSLILKMLEPNFTQRPSAKDLLDEIHRIPFQCPTCSNHSIMMGLAPWISHLNGQLHNKEQYISQNLQTMEPVARLNWFVSKKLGGYVSFSKGVMQEGPPHRSMFSQYLEIYIPGCEKSPIFVEGPKRLKKQESKNAACEKAFKMICNYPKVLENNDESLLVNEQLEEDEGQTRK
nr:unnamed protein product [Naegleria fowleri]